MRKGYVSLLLVASVATFCAPAGAEGLLSLENLTTHTLEKKKHSEMPPGQYRGKEKSEQ